MVATAAAPMMRNSCTPKPSKIGRRETVGVRVAHEGLVAGHALACNNIRAATTARGFTGRIVGLRASPVKTPCLPDQTGPLSW